MFARPRCTTVVEILCFFAAPTIKFLHSSVWSDSDDSENDSRDNIYADDDGDDDADADADHDVNEDEEHELDEAALEMHSSSNGQAAKRTKSDRGKECVVVVVFVVCLLVALFNCLHQMCFLFKLLLPRVSRRVSLHSPTR